MSNTGMYCNARFKSPYFVRTKAPKTHPGVPNIISYSHNSTVKHLKRYTNIAK